jgi:hypothetical protein
MKKSDFKKANKALLELKENLINDFDIFKKADLKEFNFTYLQATIEQVKEVNKSILLLEKYLEKKKIRFQ